MALVLLMLGACDDEGEPPTPHDLGDAQAPETPHGSDALAGGAGDEFLPITEPRARPAGPRGDSTGHGVAVDSHGNVFVVGATMGALAGATSKGGRDGFVAKYSADGRRRWVRQYGSVEDDQIAAVALMPDGDLAIAGRTKGQVGRDPAAGDSDAFVARLSPDGEERWVAQYGTLRPDYATGVAVSADGLIYVASVAQEMWNEDHALGVLSCLDGDGALRWRDEWGGTPGVEPTGVATGEGVVYVVGRRRVRRERLQNGSSLRWIGDAFVRSYDDTGQVRWEHSLDGVDTIANAVAVDAEQGVVVVGTRFQLQRDNLSLVESDLWLWHHNVDGNVQWTRYLNTLAMDSAHGVAVLSDGDLAVAGNAGDLDQDPSTGDGAFIMRTDPKGNPRWVRQSYPQTLLALGAAPDATIYATGWRAAWPLLPERTTTDAFVLRVEEDGSGQGEAQLAAALPAP